MFNRLKRIWRPANFHYHHLLNGSRTCFEGWYFKLVDATGGHRLAIIPGVFLGPEAHAFIQVLDGNAGTATYHRFPIEAFSASHEVFDVQIAGSRFNRSGITLDIEAGQVDDSPAIQGSITFGEWQGWPVTLTKPGVMGPYGFIPFMQCNHGILSMDHALSGQLRVGEAPLSFDGGRGYVEKDWGKGFPLGYVWLQCNHFTTPGVSLSGSIATIPWLTGAFRGYLVGLLLDGKIHRFTTYTGARVEHVAVDDEHVEVSVVDRNYRLRYSATRSHGGVLLAPYENSMVERVAESMDARVELRLEDVDSGRLILEDSGAHGCLEVQGDLQPIQHGY